LPIYTYECQSCGSSLERRQSFSDDPLTVHDECGGSLRRVIYPAGIVFKGSGFYNTDYKNTTASNKATADATESKSSDSATSESSSGAAASTNGSANSGDSSSSKSESKSESKPATTSPAPAPTTP
jgi:putative FmdB family regulatory protein